MAENDDGAAAVSGSPEDTPAPLPAFISRFFGGGDGLSEPTAFVITADNYPDGMAAQYGLLEWIFGRRGVDWDVERRGSGHRDRRAIDWFDVVMADGSRGTVHFDITAFHGKFGRPPSFK